MVYNFAETLINFRNAEKAFELIEKVANEELPETLSYIEPPEIGSCQAQLRAGDGDFYVALGLVYTSGSYTRGLFTEFYKDEFLQLTADGVKNRVRELIKKIKVEKPE